MNENWYARNAVRLYPLDDQAANLDDSGLWIPHGAVVDCRVVLPYSLDPEVWISGISLTDRLAAIVLVQDADDPQAIATLTLPQPLTPFRTYWMKPLIAGVTAAVAFGDPTLRYVGRCTTYAQSKLLPSSIIRYRPAAVTSMKKQGLADALVGSIQLEGSGNLTTQVTSVVVASRAYPAIVFRLSDDVNKIAVMQEMGGPCAKRPDSKTCDRAPVETIGGVVPDCNGSIGLQVIGAQTENLVLDDGSGIAIYHPVGLVDMCARINKTYVGTDDCNPEPPLDLDFPQISSVSLGASEDSGDCTVLPYAVGFVDDDPEFWEVISGNFAVGGGGYTSNCFIPNYPIGASILHSCDDADPTNRVITMDHLAGPFGVLVNSAYFKCFTGVIIGWRPYGEFYTIGSTALAIQGRSGTMRGPLFDIEVRKFMHLPPTSTQESRLALSGGIISQTSSRDELLERQRNDLLNPQHLTASEVTALTDLGASINLKIEMSQVQSGGTGGSSKTRLRVTQTRASGIAKTLAIDLPSIASAKPYSKFGVIQWQAQGTIQSFNVGNPPPPPGP